MQTARFADYDLSRLMLGTVQLGLSYGIANRTGQPDYAQARALLAAAAEAGVNGLDTAAAYGTSEEVLGKAMQELGIRDRMVVVTKVAPDKVGPDVAASIRTSLTRLRLDVLPVVLFHRESDFAQVEVLERCREQGLIRHLGVSCSGAPGGAAALLASGRVEALQIPASILDHRNRDAGVFREAARRGVAVFIRSVYLQGLLLMPEAEVPVALRAVNPVRAGLAGLAAGAGLTLAELAVRYLLSQEGVTCVLTGVETVAQLRENVDMVNRGPLPSDVLQAIDALVPVLSESILTPALWATMA